MDVLAADRLRRGLARASDTNDGERAAVKATVEGNE